ncbi:MAG: hypothetical protein ABFD91_05330 [Anaerohalosphaeraceae bacterium]
MYYICIQLLIAGLLFQTGCSSSLENHTQQHQFTNEEIKAIADKEVHRRGLDKKYGYAFNYIRKHSALIYATVLTSDGMYFFTLDENGGIIEIEGEQAEEMYSLLKLPSSTQLKTKKDVQLYMADILKTYMPNKTVKTIQCLYYPKGWWVNYNDCISTNSYDVIVREDGTVDQIAR